MTGTALSIVDLSVRLGGRTAVDGVSLRVEPGDRVGLIGPNGAGKTTLLRTVLGLLKPAAGRVEVGGRPAARARDTVGYVPQRHEFAWDFPITVAGAVRSARTRRPGFPRRSGAEDRAAVAEAIERVGMTDLRDRPVGELSGGQRQRVLVARALARRPGLLLLDEPFTGVDVPTQELLTGLFAELAEEGAALLMTTHDLAQAAATCTRICLLNKTVIAEGAPDELRDPKVWLEAFGVSSSRQLLTVIGGGT